VLDAAKECPGECIHVQRDAQAEPLDEDARDALRASL
jgi:ferredoxin